MAHWPQRMGHQLLLAKVRMPIGRIGISYYFIVSSHSTSRKIFRFEYHLKIKCQVDNQLSNISAHQIHIFVSPCTSRRFFGQKLVLWLSRHIYQNPLMVSRTLLYYHRTHGRLNFAKWFGDNGRGCLRATKIFLWLIGTQARYRKIIWRNLNGHVLQVPKLYTDQK